MDLLYSPQQILDYGICLSLRELLILLFAFYQLGYYFGKVIIFQPKLPEQSLNPPMMLWLPYAQNPQTSTSPSSNDIESVQQSLELINLNPKNIQDTCQPQSSQSIDLQSQLQTAPKSEDQLSREFLSQKITLQGKKIQSRAIFHMTLEKAENPNFIRKIEKHQIITDYEVPQNDPTNTQLIPFGSKKFFEVTDDSSILEISTYQNTRLQKFPIIQRKLIRAHQFDFEQKIPVSIQMSASLCENGKFNKFFKNQKKIGEGAFGVVYSVMNIFQGKEYAVKKLFIKSGLGKNKIDVILNESIRQVSIISQYSHPNIIRFYTCWLEIANLNQSINFNKMHFKSLQQIEDDDSQFHSGAQLNFKKKKSAQECLQISYVSSQANSGFAFQNQSRNSFANSNKNQIQVNSPSHCQIISTIQNNKYNENHHSQHNGSEFVPIFALYIQMELCKQGSLDRYLQKRIYLNKDFAFIIIDQLLHGVQYLHSNGLVHRDLKPGNILINKKQRLIKIADFGLSTKIDEDIQFGKIGTPSYIAPEILQKRPIRKEQLHLTDVYSIGVIYFQLLNLFNFTTKHEKLQKINRLKEGRVDLHQDFTLEKKLIKLMTRSFNRLSIQEIFVRKEYIELSQLISKEKEILSYWQQISGLQAEDAIPK